MEKPPACAILGRMCSELQAENLRVATKALPVLAEDRTLWSKLGIASETTEVGHSGIRTQAQGQRERVECEPEFCR